MTNLMSRPWPEVRGNYSDAPVFLWTTGMLKLIDRLAGSSLHGWISMFDLCVTKEPCVYLYEGTVVKICPVADASTVEIQWPGEPIHVVEAADLVAEFERLAKQDSWLQGSGNGA